jgi:DNA replication protein DnaC
MTDAIMPDASFLASLLTELRLPSNARNWRRIAEAADREGWPAQKTIAALMEIEVAERASRRIQRHRDQSEAPSGAAVCAVRDDGGSRQEARAR